MAEKGDEKYEVLEKIGTYESRISGGEAQHCTHTFYILRLDSQVDDGSQC
jgi:hypothetical protein